MSRDLILRSRAAKYLNTSIVVLTEQEYQKYLSNLIDFNYPRLRTVYHLSMGSPNTQAYKNFVASSLTAVQRNNDYREFLRKTIPQATEAEKQTFTKKAIIQAMKAIATLYAMLTFKSLQGGTPLEADLYEWWLLTPTGPESCSRDVGEVRNLFEIGKGDEWDEAITASVFAYQLSLPHQLLPTGYVCAETLRRRRMVV